MTDLYRRMTQTHAHLLDHFGERLASVEMDWQHGVVPDEIDNRTQITCIDRLRSAYFGTTQAFLRYLSEEGHYPITEGNFRDAWEDICIDAANSPANNYAVVLCQALIEIGFIASGIDSAEESLWVQVIARVKRDGDTAVVDDAFDRILAYEYREERFGVWTTGEEEEMRDQYYRNLISAQGQPLNTHPDFPGRVEALREQAEERLQELEER